jgi:sec-independent protein translocase protein TatA
MTESTMSVPMLAFGLPHGSEWIIILVIGLLLFGRRLPEVGRSIGKSIVEFKRGIKGINDEIETESGKPGESTAQLTDDAVAHAKTDSADVTSPAATPSGEKPSS